MFGETSEGLAPNAVFVSLSSSEKLEGFDQSKMVGMMIPGWVGDSPDMKIAEFSSEWEGV